jgi:hypothetical protein
MPRLSSAASPRPAGFVRASEPPLPDPVGPPIPPELPVGPDPPDIPTTPFPDPSPDTLPAARAAA